MVPILFLIFTSLLSHAQWQKTNWLNIDYTYTDFSYTEPNIKESGAIAGLRGDLGINLVEWLAIGFGGNYADANLSYDGDTFTGTQVKTITKDRFFSQNAHVDLIYGPFVISTGWAQRSWRENLVVSYKKDVVYEFTPIDITYFTGPFYFSYEHRIWGKGQSKTFLGEVDPLRVTTSHIQKHGSGYDIEIGWRLPSPIGATRLFANYSQWSVDASDVVNDGVANQQIPSNITKELALGIGVMF